MAWAGELVVKVQDMQGRPVADAAVYAEPATRPAAPAPVQSSSKVAEVEQRGKKFLPLVTVIQVGSSLAFPNNDTVRHHVYSFSPTKVFELPLYSGVTGKTIVFDKPGTAVLGCNIHDFMLAFVQVVDTPWFSKSNPAGEARLSNLPAGNYRLKVWRYALANENAVPEQALVMKASDGSVVVKLELKRFTLPAGTSSTIQY